MKSFIIAIVALFSVTLTAHAVSTQLDWTGSVVRFFPPMSTSTLQVPSIQVTSTTTTSSFAGGITMGGWALSTSTVVCMAPEKCQYQADGANDNVQIQQAINAVHSAGGGTVLIKNGVYSIASVLSVNGLTNALVITGSGSSTVLRASSSLSKIIGSSGDNTRNLTLSYLTLDGNNTAVMGFDLDSSLLGNHNVVVESITAINATSHGISVDNCVGCKILDNHVFNNGARGIYVSGSGIGTGNLIDGNTVHDNGTYGIQVDSSTHDIVSNNVVYNQNVERGIYMVQAENCIVEGNTTYNNNLAGIGLNTTECLAVGNHIENNTLDGILVNSSSFDDTTGKRNNIAGNYIRGNGRYGIQSSSYAENNNYSGNYISNNAGGGIRIQNFGFGNSIVGNYFYDNGDGVTNAGVVHITGTSTNNTVTQNYFWTSTTTPKSIKGIVVSGSGSTDNHIGENTFRNMVTSGIDVGTTPGTYVSWQANASSTYFGNGFVGIGTTEPLALLSVDGVSQRSHGANSPNILLNSSPITGLSLSYGGKEGNGNFGYNHNLIGVNLWYDKDTDTLNRYGTSGGFTGTAGILMSADAGSGIGSNPRMSFITGSSPSENMTITGGGFVGIGTTSPLSILQVGNNNNANQYLSFITSNNHERGINYYLSDGTTIRGFIKWDSIEDLLLKGDDVRISAGSVTDALVVKENTGLVGIGTTSPSARFTVSGDMRLTGRFADSSSSTGSVGSVLTATANGTAWVATSSLGLGAGGGSGTVASGTAGQVAFYGANGTAVSGTSTLFISSNTTVGVGTTTPQAELHVQPSVGILPFLVSSSSGATMFNILANGNVGIGSTTPVSALGVTGTTTANGFVGTNWNPTRALFVNANREAVTEAASASLLNSLTDETGTGVAVFGTSPTFTTQITAPLVVGGTAVGSTLTFRSTSGNGTSDAIIFQVGNNGAREAARFFTRGQFSVGTTSSSSLVTIASTTAPVALYVRGTTTLDGIVTLAGLGTSTAGNALCIIASSTVVNAGNTTCVSSSARYKQDIDTLGIGTWRKLLDIDVVDFNYRPEFADPVRDAGGKRLGFIAEQVEDVDPQLVQYGPDGKAQSIHYDGVIALAVQAIQDLQAQIDGVTGEAKKSAQDHWQWVAIAVLFAIVGVQQWQLTNLRRK